MAAEHDWVDIGSAEELSRTPPRRITVRNRDLALSFRDGGPASS